MENPIKMDDLGVPLFSETLNWIKQLARFGARALLFSADFQVNQLLNCRGCRDCRVLKGEGSRGGV